MRAKREITVDRLQEQLKAKVRNKNKIKIPYLCDSTKRKMNWIECVVY